MLLGIDLNLLVFHVLAVGAGFLLAVWLLEKKSVDCFLVVVEV